MKDRAMGLLAAVVVLGIGAGVYVWTPRLQATTTRRSAEADVKVESAARLLADYRPRIAMVRALVPDMEWQATGGELDADLLARLTEDYARDFEQVDQVLRALKAAFDRGRQDVPEVSREVMEKWGYPEPFIEDAFFVAGRTGRRESAYRETLAGAEPESPPSLLRGLGAGAAQQATALRQVMQRIRREFDQNARLLTEAAAHLQEGLSLVPDHVSANRLLAAVEYHRALEKRFEGLGRRRFAEMCRPRVVQLVTELEMTRTRAEAVRENRGVDLAIDEARRAVEELTHRIAEQQNVVQRLEETLRQQEQEIESLRSMADAAQQTFERVLEADYDHDDPAAFAEYVATIRQAGQAMSAAAGQLEAAERGTVSGVELDPPDDWLHGKYVTADGSGQGTYQRGLAAISRELASERARLNTMRTSMADMAARVSHLEAIRTDLDEDVRRLDEHVDGLSKQLVQAVDECGRFVAEAETAEQQGLSDHLEKSLRHIRAAQRGEASRMSAASSARSQAGSAPTERLDRIQNERWLSAGLEALEGETLLLRARFHFQRAADLRSHLRAMRAAAQAGATEAAPKAVEERMEDARYEALEAAYAAAEKYNKALRSDPQWVYQANLGVAMALLCQIDPTNEEYRTTAIETLRACIQGREDQPAVTRMAATLASLEGTPGADSDSDPSESEEDPDDSAESES